MEPTLPNHPFVAFKELTESFAKKNIPSSFKRKLFIKVMNFWNRIFRISEKEQEIPQAIAAGKDGFFHREWIFRKFFNPEISATFILAADSETDPICKAAQLVYAALLFQQKLLNNEIATEYESNKPLDMQRYHYFYSRILLSTLDRGKPQHLVTDFESTDYILVMIDGYFYYLQVIKDQKILSYPELVQQLSLLVRDAKQQFEDMDNNRIPLGLLTTMIDKKSIGIYQKLYQLNPEIIEKINRARFALAIDLHDAPQSLEQLFRKVHTDNFHNRDYRRSLQIVVTANAQAGLIVNPYAGLGGTLSSSFIGFLAEKASELQQTKVKYEQQGALLFARCQFQGVDLSLWQKQFTQLQQEIYSRLYINTYSTTYRINNIGKRHFQALSLSTDAAFHCAIHLAYYKCYGKIPVVGSFINVRNVKHGDIWRYKTSSEEMDNFIKNPNRDTLFLAMEKHKALIKENKQAKDEFYLGAMTLIKLINQRKVPFISFISLMLIMQCFIKGFSRNIMGPNIWVSNIATHKGIEIAGRPGVRLSYLLKNTLGGHYMIFDNYINLCMLSGIPRKSHYLTEAKFVEHLTACMLEIKNMTLQMVKLDDSSDRIELKKSIIKTELPPSFIQDNSNRI